MTSLSKLSRMIREWAEYLEQKGHLVGQSLVRGAASTFDLLSSDEEGTVFLWKAMCGATCPRSLTRGEMTVMKSLAVAARRHRARPYVVVRYKKPASRVAVLPLRRVLKSGTLGSHDGGIQWPPELRPE